MTEDRRNSTSLADQLRLRLRRDPGDELIVDGKKTHVNWPASFVRVAPGLFAEIVLDLPATIQSFPMDAWSGTPQELLKAAWTRTLNRTKYEIEELDVGLDEPLLVIKGEAPYITAFALSPCTVFKQPDGKEAFAALVAIPTPEYLLLYPFWDKNLSDAETTAQQMANIAVEQFYTYEEKRRVSPFVYMSYANKAFELERYPVNDVKLKKTLYIPDSMLQEIADEAARTDRSISYIVQYAWTCARQRLIAAHDREAAEKLRPLSMPAASTEERKQSLYFPMEMLAEMEESSKRFESSISWAVQLAYSIARTEVRALPAVSDRR